MAYVAVYVGEYCKYAKWMALTTYFFNNYSRNNNNYATYCVYVSVYSIFLERGLVEKYGDGLDLALVVDPVIQSLFGKKAQ